MTQHRSRIERIEGNQERAHQIRDHCYSIRSTRSYCTVSADADTEVFCFPSARSLHLCLRAQDTIEKLEIVANNQHQFDLLVLGPPGEINEMGVL